MKVTALLPMKGNSERVKGKNFKSFKGKPLFRWVLDNLLAVDEIDKVIINTDAKKLLEQKGLPNNNKIQIRDRRKEIQGDLVSMNIIIEDDLNNIESDIYLMTHTTNPLLSKETLTNAIKLFKEHLLQEEYDSLFSVNRIQTRFYDHKGHPINHNPKELLRTQDLEPWYEENSNLYLFTKESFRKTKARIGLRPYMLVTPLLESTDIDTPEDWDLAETLVTHYEQKGLI